MPRPNTSAFLMTQLGTIAAGRFAQRVAEIGLTPPECGVLGLLGGRSGMSQQQLADTLGMIPSRVVPLVDGLEQAALVTRVRDQSDRRRNALELTDAGRRALAQVATIGRTHDEDFTASLTGAQRRQLHDLLERLADAHDLTPGVHPGYRSLDTRGKRKSRPGSEGRPTAHRRRPASA